jgi:hypothetical protein
VDPLEVTRLSLGPQRSVLVVHHAAPEDSERTLAALGLEPPRRVIVVNGGTSSLPDDTAALLTAAMAGIVEAAEATDAVLITGGTDAGIFAVLGGVLQDRQGAPPTVGVAPERRVSTAEPTAAAPEAPPAAGPDLGDTVGIEPHHSHVVLTVGDEWGDETPTLLALVDRLTAPGARSVAVIAGGGKGTEVELEGHLAAGRPVVVLEGSGRLADRAAVDAADGVIAVPLEGGAAALCDVLVDLLR